MTTGSSRIFAALSVLLVLLCGSMPCPGGSRGFEAALEEAGPKYQAATEGQIDLFLSGRMDEAFGLLTGLVPDGEKGPADYFILGNMLYTLNPDLSREFHRRAFEEKPKVVIVMLEHALELHRHGQYAEAAELYRKVLKKEKSLARYYALLADCQLRTGDIKGAVKSWKMSNFSFGGHSGIDFAIHSIYGEPSPWARRAELLAALDAEPGKAPDLVLLDLRWDTDWWNWEANLEALNHDMALLEKKLGADSWRFTDLQTLVWIRTSEGLSDNMTGRKLASAGLLLDGGRLPQDSLMAVALMSMVLEKKLATHAAMYEAFGEELDKRARSVTGDLEALHLLAALVIEADPGKLEEIDRYGWDRYGDEQFACSLLAGKGEKLTFEDPDLTKALAQFPDCPVVHLVAMNCALGGGAPTRPLLVDLIKAEFNGLDSDPGRFGHKLNLYFMTLDDMIKRRLK